KKKSREVEGSSRGGANKKHRTGCHPVCLLSWGAARGANSALDASVGLARRLFFAGCSRFLFPFSRRLCAFRCFGRRFFLDRRQRDIALAEGAEIDNQVSPLFRLADTGEGHLGALDIVTRLGDEVIEIFIRPLTALFQQRARVAEA